MTLFFLKKKKNKKLQKSKFFKWCAKRTVCVYVIVRGKYPVDPRTKDTDYK